MLNIFDRPSILILVVTLPLVVSLISPLKKLHRNFFYLISLMVPLINVALLMSTPAADTSISLSRFFVFSIDQHARLYGILVNVCWFLTILYAVSYVRHHFQEKASIFHLYLSASVSIVLAAGFASNFFTLLLFYTASIPIAYPLITIREETKSLQAGKIFLYSTLGPALLLVLPTVLLNFPLLENFHNYSIQSLGFNQLRASLVLALLIIGFSKNSVAPFHLWLSKTAVAPAPVCALVHSVGAVQTAIIALIKIGLYVYGTDTLAELNDHFLETGWLTYLCGGTALYAAYRAYKTQDLKERFSFSTVSQLSYIITAILIGTKKSILAAVLHMVTHSFGKMNLFFIAGLFTSVLGSSQVSVVSPWLKKHRLIAVAAAISGLSIAGFPLLAGYYSKDLMLIEELHRHHYAAALFLVSGSVMNLFYIWPILKTIVSPRDFSAANTSHNKNGTIIMNTTIGICTAILIIFTKYVYIISRALE